MVFNYPTLAECYKYAAYDALALFADVVVNRTRGATPRANAICDAARGTRA